MNTPYSEKWQASRDRLRQTLAPQTNREHHMVEWLIGNFTADEADEWFELTDRRTRTAVRAARMELADFVLRHWEPGRVRGSVTDVEDMMLIASGGQTIAEVIGPDDNDVQPSSQTVQDAHARAREVAAAYDRGFDEGSNQDVKTAIEAAHANGHAEGVAAARSWQEQGLDPETWPTGRGGDDERR